MEVHSSRPDLVPLPLDTICNYANGVWSDTRPDGVPVLRSTDFLSDGNLSYHTAIRLNLTDREIAKARLMSGDILLERSGGGPNKPVGRVAYFSGEGLYCFGNFITRLRIAANFVDSRYLFHFLRLFHISGGTERLQTQTTNIRNLRFREYLDTPIPIPYPDDPARSLLEQRRIVERLEALLAEVREMREAAQAILNSLPRVMEAALGEVYPDHELELTPAWEWRNLLGVCQLNPRRPRIKRNDSALTSFVPMQAVDEHTGTIVDMQTRPFEQVKRGYTYFEEEDVLMAKITPSMENGKAAIARHLIDGIGFGTTEFHVFRPNPGVLSEWLFHFIRRRAFRVKAKASFRGAVGQQRVPEDFFHGQQIPIPYPDDLERSLVEQRRIVTYLENIQTEVQAARELAEADLRAIDRLEQAILAAAFRGEL